MSHKAKVTLQTLGCRLNQSETEVITQSLQAQGYEIVSEGEPADIYVINTCTVTGRSDSKNRQLIRSIHRKYPEADIAVIGCYAQMEPQTLAALEGVKLVIGSEKKLQLAHYLEEARQSPTPLVIHSKISKASFETPLFESEPQNTRTNLKIQDGCNFMCTFCIIPFARGRSRSRAFENLMEEARMMVRAGVKEIVLTGVNLGDFQHQEYSFLSVIDALNELSGLERIRISSLEPTTVSKTIFEYMSDPQHKLVAFFHLPLQSGSNHILQLMRRQYSVLEFEAEIMKAYEHVPDVCLGTDVMVGFPGETEAHFNETRECLQRLPLTYFHVFPYSERKGTPAVLMEGKVSSEDKRRRGEILRNLSHQQRSQFLKRFIGTTRNVLFELAKTPQKAEGYTDNYMRVIVNTPLASTLRNQIHPVRFLEQQGDSLRGEIPH
ncbi:tRNA (N(6)-L-threonylcarbamoyladenosine(37)-C(2))-methylthiotransferase MtaB [Deltaproteobacteria bacterium TL4]